MPETKKFHLRLAEYFARKDLYLDAEDRKKPNTRKLVELPFQQVNADILDEAIETICNLFFIEAKCINGLIFDLVNDHKLIYNSLPEAQNEIEMMKKQEARISKWTREIVEYSKKWDEKRDVIRSDEKVSIPAPIFPEVVPSVKMWTNEEIEEDIKRIINDPLRLDRLRAFENFVNAESYSLNNYSFMSGFVIQNAYNYAPAGPVNQQAKRIISKNNFPMLIRKWEQSDIYNPHQALKYTLIEHRDNIHDLKITADGKRAVSAGEDKILCVWDIESGTCLHKLEGHTNSVKSVKLTLDGKFALSGSLDKTFRIWDIEKGTFIRTLKGNDKLISVKIRFDSKNAILGSEDKSLNVKDIEIEFCPRIILEDGIFVGSESITPDGNRAVLGRERTLYVFDMKTGQCSQTLEGHDSAIVSSNITSDGKLAVSGSKDGILKLWNIETGQCLRTLRGSFFKTSVTPDGKILISGRGNKLDVWNIVSGQCTQEIEQKIEHVLKKYIKPNSQLVGKGNKEGILDIASGKYIRKLDGLKGDLFSCYAITPNSKQMIISEDKSLKAWDLESGQFLRTLGEDIGYVVSINITPDGKRASCRILDHPLTIWDIDSGQRLHTLEGHRDSISCDDITPNSKQAISGSYDKSIKIWDIESGQCLRTLESHSHFSDLKITPDGKYIVSASDEVKVWDLKNGESICTFKGHNNTIGEVILTPDGKYVVSGRSVTLNDKTIHIWDAKSGQCIHTLEGHNSSISSVRITPDGKHVVSGDNNILRVWNIESGKCLLILSQVGNIENICHNKSCFIIFAEGIFYKTKNLPVSLNILTAFNSKMSRCSLCGLEFEPSNEVVETINSFKNNITEKNFEDLRLITQCPHCKSKLKFNPFFSADEDYISILKRGLEYSYKAEEKIAHTKALVFHLQKLNRLEEGILYLNTLNKLQ